MKNKFVNGCGHKERRQQHPGLLSNTRLRIRLLLFGVILAAGGALAAQEARTGGSGSAAELSVQLENGDGFLPQRTDLELALSRRLEAGERLVVLFGDVDMTDLFASFGNSIVYRANLLPLPPGESEIVVLLDQSGDLKEIFRQTVQVRTRRGLDEFAFRPTVDIEAIAEVDSGHSPEAGQGRPDYEEATSQLRLETSIARSKWQFSSEISLLGVTEIENALRFGEDGESADKLDLTSYLLRLENGRNFVELGHVDYGQQRYLIDGFSSRGLNAGIALGPLARFNLLAASGSQIVGFDDISGLSRSEHRMLSGAIELNPVRDAPEALRLRLTYVDGSLLPLADFNQGVINDTEESDGFAFRLSGEPTERLRFDLGYSRSSFDNPEDPFLSQGASLVAVEQETRSGYFADLDLVLVRQFKEEGWSNDLTLSINHEYVEPQYRSTAAFTQADNEQTRATLVGSTGPISYTAGHYRSQDNLDRIPSILTTKTRGYNVNFALPLSQIWSEGSSSLFLPIFTVTSDRTRQFGEGLPENSGFSASHVPDQVSLSHIGGLEWQGNRWRFGYELSFSDQDNRQPGRELNDFEQLNHSFRLDLSPLTKIDLGFSFAREKRQIDRRSDDRRYGAPGIRFLVVGNRPTALRRVLLDDGLRERYRGRARAKSPPSKAPTDLRFAKTRPTEWADSCSFATTTKI